MQILLKKVRQSESFCGPASLSSLLDFYGVKMGEREIGFLCGTTLEEGTSPEALVNFLERIGFKVVSNTHGSWKDLQKLTEKGKPVLVNWWSDYEYPPDGHYSLAYKVTDKSIFLMDPELGGYRRMSKKRFQNLWYDYLPDGRKNLRWYLFIENGPK